VDSEAAMDDLNQFAISKTLGSKIKQIGSVGFGNFRSMSTSEEIQKALRAVERANSSASFGYEDDAVVVHAFEDVRDGAPTDELLWNTGLAATFVSCCRERGLQAPHPYLIRRLINVRKNSPRYRRHGIRILPTTKKEIHPSIVPEYAHVIEFALVKLRYRYGVSIDDILMDQLLGDKFEELANQIASTLSSQDLRLGALYIRKNRVMDKKDLQKLNSLDIAMLEPEWKGVVSLAGVKPEDVPISPGLIELKEDDRYLYISHNNDIQSAVRQLGTGDAFRLLASNFWTPNLERITLCFVAGKKVAGSSIEMWERKLVHDLNPIFNWPMRRNAA
jgi:hypothetical protein